MLHARLSALDLDLLYVPQDNCRKSTWGNVPQIASASGNALIKFEFEGSYAIVRHFTGYEIDNGSKIG